MNASRNILENYKTFAQTFGWNTQHIDQALNMLNGVSPDPSGNHTRMFNNIVRFVPTVIYEGNMKLLVKEDGADWIYTEAGWDMSWKEISIDFGNNGLSFSDTWNLYRVGSLSVISEEEAKNIGWHRRSPHSCPCSIRAPAR